MIIAYTSGTLGEPKGAILTHTNILCGSTNPEFYGYTFTSEDIYLSYVPLSHVYEQIMLSAALISSYRIGFSSGAMVNLL